MKVILTRPIMCQSRGCTEKATWRELDAYTQQKQTFSYFYYLCDEHKEKAENGDTVGHNRQFDMIL